MSHQTIMWIAFGILVPLILALDLGIFHRKAHAVKIKEALIWSAVWIALSLLFSLGIYLMLDSDRALKFITGYLVEKSLSVDNLFIFFLIFKHFNVPAQNQHRVLFWGILGAIVIRGLFIITGITLLGKLQWIIYIFGAFLVYTGIKLSTEKDKEYEPGRNPVLRLFRRFVPLTRKYHGSQFMVKAGRHWLATPLLLVLVVIETTDIVFAVDSVPAILAITLDTFTVYTSNIFAILGLRALYFALAGVIQQLRYLNYGLAVILVFLGIKMIISSDFFHIHVQIPVSLGVIVGVLALAAVASVIWPPKKDLTP